MNNQRFLFLMLLIGYTFAPTLFGWMVSPQGSWVKPFIVWFLVIVGAYLFQKYHKTI